MRPRRASFLALAAATVGTVCSLVVSVVPAQALPPGPSNLRVVGISATRIQIAWNAVPGAPSYRVQYSTAQDFSSSVKAGTTATAYLMSSLKPNTQYYFRVAGLDGAARVTDWSAGSARTRYLMKFAVASFNIKDPDAREFNDRFGEWDVRGKRSAAAIVGQGVKLAGIQELFEDNEREDFLAFVNQKAGGTYFDMVPNIQEDAGDDSRILYDTRSFRHVSSGGVEYPTQSGSESRAFGWGKFQHRTSGRYVLFVTTRLSPRSDSVDVAQWKQLIGWLNKVRTANPSYRFIITGDFNATKFERVGGDDGPPVAQLARMRSNGYEDVLGQINFSYSTYRNPSVRVDSWICSSNQQQKDVRRPNCVVSPGRNSNSIDYIFVSKALKATYYRVYAQPRTGYVMNYLTSDHFMVRATISE